MLVKFYLVYGNSFLCEARWYLNPFGHWHLYPFCTLSLTSVSSKAIHWPPFSQLRSSSCILVWFLPFSTLLESFCSFLGEQFHVTLRIISSCKIDSSVILKMVYKSKIIISKMFHPSVWIWLTCYWLWCYKSFFQLKWAAVKNVWCLHNGLL